MAQFPNNVSLRNRFPPINPSWLLGLLALLVGIASGSWAAEPVDVPNIDGLPRQSPIPTAAHFEPKSVLRELDTLVGEEINFPVVPTILSFQPELRDLWLEALKRPESDLHREAADAITRAHQLGMSGLEACIPALLAVLEKPEQNLTVRRSAAQALIQLEARQAAVIFRELARGNLGLAQVVEPALADWNDAPMREIWLERLEKRDVGTGRLLLAIQAAKKVELTQAIPLLRNLLHVAALPPNIRVESAAVLSSMRADGLAEDAERLLSAGPATGLVERITAMRLLDHESSPKVEEILGNLALDSEPPVAAAAYRRLLAIDPRLTVAAANQVRETRDPSLRLLLIETLRQVPSPRGIAQLGELLADSHPHVRRSAQQALGELDRREDDARQHVRNAAMRMLTSDATWGIARAAILVGTIEHEPAADRLIELLDHDNAEVFIASAWALRRLARTDTAEAIYEKLNRDVEDSLTPRPLDANVDWIYRMYQQQEHLIEALGVLRYRPADSLLRMFFAKPPPPPIPPPNIRIDSIWRPELRSRALWALSRLHENEPPEDLTALSDRIAGLLDDQSDAEPVRIMAAYALAQIRPDGSTEERLRQYYQPGVDYGLVPFACYQGLEKMLGESLPPPRIKPHREWQTGWFLEPHGAP